MMTCCKRTYGGGGGEGSRLLRAENGLGLLLAPRPFAGDDANWIDRRRFGISFLTESENPRDLSGARFSAADENDNDDAVVDDDDGERTPFLFKSETAGAAKVTELWGETVDAL